jgi:hypothetical protein
MKPQAISKLKSTLCGRIILPEDQDYHEARKVYNGIILRAMSTIWDKTSASLSRGQEITGLP